MAATRIDFLPGVENITDMFANETYRKYGYLKKSIFSFIRLKSRAVLT